MSLWQKVLQDGINDTGALAARLGIETAGLEAVTARYPLRINAYWLGRMGAEGAEGGPLWRQAVPDLRELEDDGLVDPLAEEALSPAPSIVHRYPDRVLFLVSNRCAMYCRFCTRKRMVGTQAMRCDDAAIAAGLDYIRKTPAVREVLLSGGDPLLLPDERLAAILAELRAIPHVEVLRIGTRVPATLPMRVTPMLSAMLARFQPLYVNTHFNHPDELTPEAAAACALLADAGIPLGCQTVLLKGINDNAATLAALFTGLLRLRVRPYYLHQMDLARGTAHFRAPIEQGLALMGRLIGHLSGMAIPTYALDLPGGGGKVPLLPEYLVAKADQWVFRNFQGREYGYPREDGV